MIPGPISPGPAAPPRGRRGRAIPPGAWVGALLVVAGVAGAVLWMAALSPYGFRRFPLVEGDRVLTIHRAGSYEVFEEFPGATEPHLPPPLEVTVIDVEGHGTAVESLVRPGDRSPVDAYDVPLYEGRGLARFSVSRPGRYLLRVDELDPHTYGPGDYSSASDASIAVGPSIAATWVGSPWIGMLVGPAVFAVGIAVIIVTTTTATRAGRSDAQPRVRGRDSQRKARTGPGGPRDVR